MKIFKHVLPLLVAGLSFTPARADSGSGQLCAARNESLSYLLNSQTKADGEDYKIGEWGSQIQMGGFPLKMGVLKPGPFEDANAFTVSSVQNILAEIYLGYKKDQRIPDVLNKARFALKRYRMNDGGYNFWPKNLLAGPDGHRPTSQITSKTFGGLVTIPADADDTSLVYLSLLLDEQILGPDNADTTASTKPTSIRDYPIGNLYQRYTDNFHTNLATFLQKKAAFTGAYMTWLEHGPIFPLLTSAFMPQSAGPRVVLGLNNVDCVVVGNVMRTLAKYDQKDTKGYEGSCKFLTSMARHQRYNECGVYYPDTYWMPLTVARAYEDGATCLKEAVDLNIQYIMSKQQPNGSWHNEVVNEDDNLATALAASALIKTGDRTNPDQQQALRRALDYLTGSAMKNEANETYWNGGVFFSAGVLVRRGVLWRSNSYTTALITQVLFEAKKWFPEELTCAN